MDQTIIKKSDNTFLFFLKQGSTWGPFPIVALPPDSSFDNPFLNKKVRGSVKDKYTGTVVAEWTVTDPVEDVETGGMIIWAHIDADVTATLTPCTTLVNSLNYTTYEKSAGVHVTDFEIYWEDSAIENVDPLLEGKIYVAPEATV